MNRYIIPYDDMIRTAIENCARYGGTIVVIDDSYKDVVESDARELGLYEMIDVQTIDDFEYEGQVIHFVDPEELLYKMMGIDFDRKEDSCIIPQ